MLPAKDTEPMTMLNTLGNADGEGRVVAKLEQLGHRHQGRSAAAHPVEEGDHLRNRSHLHPARAHGPHERADHDSNPNHRYAGGREVEQGYRRD